jgi:hypothetical protein
MTTYSGRIYKKIVKLYNCNSKMVYWENTLIGLNMHTDFNSKMVYWENMKNSSYIAFIDHKNAT